MNDPDLNLRDHNHAEDGEELHDDGAFHDEPFENIQDWPADSDDDGQEEPEQVTAEQQGFKIGGWYNS